MASIDWPYEQLVEYTPELTKKDDFDAFWEQQKKALSQIPMDIRLKKVSKLSQGKPYTF